MILSLQILVNDRRFSLAKHSKVSFFSGVYCADLDRHRKTTQYILRQNLHFQPEIVEHTGFREWGFGGYEGKSDKEMWPPLFEKYGLQYNAQFTDFQKLMDILGDRGIYEEIAHNDPTELAEHYDNILSRAALALNRVLTDNEGSTDRNVLIVTSGNIIPTILHMSIPDACHDEFIENCSVTTLTYDEGKYSLKKLADTSHLGASTS